jgi:hypothetical protein
VRIGHDHPAGRRPGPPTGIRFLLISCFDGAEPQFRGIGRAIELLGRSAGFAHLPWASPPREESSAPARPGLPPASLQRRRALRWTLISGHGCEDRPRIGDNRARFLSAADLRLPAPSALYLAACYQGRPELQARWSAACGVPPSRVYGCPTETDSLLSACLLLHLVEEGLTSIERWFPRWVQANTRLQPHFPLLRRIYLACRRDALLTLAEADNRLDLAPIRDFLQVIPRYPDLLSGLSLEPLRRLTGPAAD